MRRLLAWISGLVGGIAVYRVLARRRRPAAEVPAAAGDDPRAAELRTKLAQRAGTTEEAGTTESAEPSEIEPLSVGEPAPGTAETPDPDERRRQVHERGREAVDRMRGSAPPE